MAKTLITGFAGFIGSHVLDALAAREHRVFGVDNLRSGNLEFVKETGKLSNVSLRIMSFANKSVLEEVAAGMYDVVIHLAAIPRIGYSIQHPAETFETNVLMTFNLIEACRVSKTKFVFASSSSIYGETIKDTPLFEALTPDIKSPYAHHKLFIEQQLKLYSRLYGLDSVSLRFFSVFGPRSLPKSSYPTFIGTWLYAIKSGMSPELFGTGAQQRDFCYVSNIVQAVVKAVELDKPLDGKVLNVACGERHSLLEIQTFLSKRYQFSFKQLPARVADVSSTWADLTETRAVLGYEPTVFFEQGLASTCDWFDQNWGVIRNL